MLKEVFFVSLWALLVISNPVIPNVSQESPLRLISKVVPSAYTLTIAPHFPKDDASPVGTFSGKIIIEAEVHEDGVSSTVLHASKSPNPITLSKVKCLGPKDANVDCKFGEISDSDTVTLSFNKVGSKDPQEFKKGDKIKLEIDYESKMATDMYGFYLSSYKDSKGKTR